MQTDSGGNPESGGKRIIVYVSFEEQINNSKGYYYDSLKQSSVAWDTNENNLYEAERLNMLLPVMKWEIENNQLTEWIRDEIYQYYEDIQKRGFGDVIDESEREKVVHDLTECFNKAFPEGLEK